MSRILTFNLTDPARRAAVMALSVRLDFACTEVPPEHQHLSLRELLTDTAATIPCPTPFREEMLVLHQFSDADLDILLQALRSAGVRIPLKAVVTETNLGWTALQLRNALLAESLMMKPRT